MMRRQGRWVTFALILGLSAGTFADPVVKKGDRLLRKERILRLFGQRSESQPFHSFRMDGGLRGLKIDDGNTTDPADGKTCIKITYSGQATQGANWTGVFWQHPANNWGEKPGGLICPPING